MQSQDSRAGCGRCVFDGITAGVDGGRNTALRDGGERLGDGRKVGSRVHFHEDHIAGKVQGVMDACEQPCALHAICILPRREAL